MPAHTEELPHECAVNVRERDDRVAMESSIDEGANLRSTVTTGSDPAWPSCVLPMILADSVTSGLHDLDRDVVRCPSVTRRALFEVITVVVSWSLAVHGDLVFSGHGDSLLSYVRDRVELFPNHTVAAIAHGSAAHVVLNETGVLQAREVLVVQRNGDLVTRKIVD